MTENPTLTPHQMLEQASNLESSPAFLALCAESPIEDIRKAALLNPATPLGARIAGLKSASQALQLALAENPNLHPHLRHELQFSPYQKVAQKSLAVKAAYSSEIELANSTISGPILAVLAQSTDPGTRQRVAASLHATVDTVIMLAVDRDPMVRATARQHPRLPAKILKSLELADEGSGAQRLLHRRHGLSRLDAQTLALLASSRYGDSQFQAQIATASNDPRVVAALERNMQPKPESINQVEELRKQRDREVAVARGQGIPV